MSGRRRFVSIVALLLAPSLACLAALPDGFAAALKEGRRLSAKGDYPAAIKSFDQALAAVPHDPTALSELGFAALKAGQLDRARKCTLEAVDGAGDPHIKAATLYNLGLIDEAQGNPAAAIGDYQRSLALRPNKTVEAKLAALQSAVAPVAGAAGGGSDALGIDALTGPKRGLGEVCAAAFPGKQCKLDGAPVAQLAAPTSPYQAVEVVTTPTDEGESDLLLIRTARGWYFRPLGDRQQQGGKFGTRESLDVKELAARPLATDGAPAIVLRYTAASLTGTDDGTDADYEDRMVLCGVGASGVPSCSDRLLVGKRAGTLYHGKPKGSSLRVDFLPANEVRFTSGGGKLEDDEKQLLGKHRVVFP